MKSVVHRAGIIPYYIESDKTVRFMFMVPSDPKYGGSDYQIAKGRIENDEDTLEAALREGEEELGLLRENITTITPLGVFLGRTTFFLVRVKDPNHFTTPEYETKETKWLTQNEFEQDGRDIHKHVVKSAQRFVEFTENTNEENHTR